MKRDIHFVRQLLLEIERRGAECPIDTLYVDTRHDTLRHDSEDRVRHHLWLLIDTGWVKDADRTAAGVPCVRLTNAGQEFLELARSERRWQNAVTLVVETTGGTSLAVLRTLLAKWALRVVARGERRLQRVGVRRLKGRGGRRLWLDRFALEADPLWDDDQARLVRRSAYRERADVRPATNGATSSKLPEQFI